MATPWAVPPDLFAGRRVAVMASGQSMTPAIAEQVRAMGCAVIVVNETYRLAPWADVLYGADAPWWKVRQDEALHFRGIKVTATESVPYPQVMCLRDTGKEGFDPDPECIRTGGNGGYAGIHIAAHGNPAEILLFGFDMKGGHWHGAHPKPLRNTTPETYKKWLPRFATLAAALRERGIPVTNCTPGSLLRCFPFDEARAARAA